MVYKDQLMALGIIPGDLDSAAKAFIDLKEQSLTGVCVATHWLTHKVLHLKKQVHLDWEYSGLQDPSRETSEKITPEILVKHLEEIFQDTSG
jgi:hypothetical protein